MGAKTWRDVVGEEFELAEGLAEFFDYLESCGWYARSLYGDTSVRFWPENARGKQIYIDLRFPVNEPRREIIRERITAHGAAVKNEGRNS